METVEVVIRIPKRTYDRVSERGIIAYGDDSYYIGHAIKNGTVLPKGHGRLIDADAVSLSDIGFFSIRDYDKMVHKLTTTEPTIIEADKDGE